MTKLEEKKEVKLQRGSSTKSTKQRWTLYFERDRFLQPAASCMPSGKHPSSPSSTVTTTKALPARPPHRANRPTTYQIIRSKTAFDFYVFTWLMNNVEGEKASDTEKKLYREQLGKYG